MKPFDELAKEAGLNRSQKKFCKMPVKKNIRLLAPAGSGKTFSLLWRCKYIVDDATRKSDPAPNFLIVSFTRSAQHELESRIRKEPAFKGIRATIRTLNSWGWEQIRKKGKELENNKVKRVSMVIHDLQPVLSKYPHIRDCVNKNNAADLMEISDQLKSLGFTHLMTYTEYKANIKLLRELGLATCYEECIDNLLRLEGIQGETDRTKEARVKEFFEFWKKAVVWLDSVGRYTFEDQKYWARIYFEQQVAVKKSPSGIAKYSHIMIDEFQDINPLDLMLIRSAALYHGRNGKMTSLTIVGDDDQAIFGWRGSTPRYILHPETYFGTTFTTCVLDTNYRSPKDIVALSNQLLSYNHDRVPKEIRSGAKGRAYIKVLRARRIGLSIEVTMKKVKELLRDDRFQSIALIGRRQTTLFPYQVLLGADDIPYYIDDDIDIFDGEAMRAFQQIIQTVYRAKDNDVDKPIDALLTILDLISRYKLSKSARGEVSDYLLECEVSTFEEALDAIRYYEEDLKKNLGGEKVYSVVRELINARTVYEFMEVVTTRLEGLDKDYSKKDADPHYKEPQFLRLKEISRQYGSDFRRFYRDIDRVRITAERSRTKRMEDSDKAYKEINNIKVHLMTATRSKGHEYDAVIVLDADDGVWPDRLFDDIEEERRLFHVALSRARKDLFFVVSDDRLESRFLLEMRLI